jgi:hypothetical protein
MGSPPIREIGRREFQARALDYISKSDGPEKLAAIIERRINLAGGEHCIVDGIRHLATFERLESFLGENVCLIYVQTPPDVAYDMYRAREAQTALTFSYRDYLEIYDAPVESEITSLGRKAHILLYNSFGIEAFRRTLDELSERLAKASTLEISRPIGRKRARAR